MTLETNVQVNMEALRRNEYPGRGIIIGQTPDRSNLVQIYWIMGRSENSRNRIFIKKGDVVRTAPFDVSKVKDPSLIIYNCSRVQGRVFIITNGDHTDAIMRATSRNQTFHDALCTQTYESDAPNYTPRIAGMIDLDNGQAYQLAIIKTIDNNPDRLVRYFFNYEIPIASVGHLISTYDGNGEPLPSFTGEPRPVAIVDNIDDTLNLYWNMLNRDNRIALLVRYTNINSGSSYIRIVNKHLSSA